MCAASLVVHTSNISSCQKELFQFSCGCEQLHLGRSFGFLVINIITENIIETTCIKKIYSLISFLRKEKNTLFRSPHILCVCVCVFDPV